MTYLVASITQRLSIVRRSCELAVGQPLDLIGPLEFRSHEVVGAVRIEFEAVRVVALIDAPEKRNFVLHIGQTKYTVTNSYPNLLLRVFHDALVAKNRPGSPTFKAAYEGTGAHDRRLVPR